MLKLFDICLEYLLENNPEILYILVFKENYELPYEIVVHLCFDNLISSYYFMNRLEITLDFNDHWKSLAKYSSEDTHIGITKYKKNLAKYLIKSVTITSNSLEIEDYIFM